MSDTFDYPAHLREALLGVVRRVLSGVEKGGLEGDHHLFLSFRTSAPGVSVGDSLLARYPEEMTIVLQHDYSYLEVDDEGFSVTLSFGGVPQRLHVPFSAMRVLADPSVDLVLPLGEMAAEAVQEAPDDTSEASALDRPSAAAEAGQVVQIDRFRRS